MFGANLPLNSSSHIESLTGAVSSFFQGMFAKDHPPNAGTPA